MIVYWPLGAIASDSDSRLRPLLHWWMTLGVRKGNMVVAPARSNGSGIVVNAD